MAAERRYDSVLRAGTVYDGSGAAPRRADVAMHDGRIALLGAPGTLDGRITVDADGLAIAPGFIDVHTHDDLAVIARPDMLPKVTQGVTAVVVGNCGISAGIGVLTAGTPPDPMALLGPAERFRYPNFAAYADAVREARPAVNVAALVGHTALRYAHLDRLDRAATPTEAAAMRADLESALAAGGFGLSTGLAYANAAAATTDEVMAVAAPLGAADAVYCTHLRTEFEGILGAIDEALAIGRHAGCPVIVSHLKCAGHANHGRSREVLAAIEAAEQPVGCDCYPYTASSSTLDPQQVDDRTPILITWSDPHPAMAGRMLADIASEWRVGQVEAALRLRPAGAVYHCMADEDVERILAHPATMVGSDGLPEDPRPHPRLWGAFARVLGHYSRDRGLFPLGAAVRKMTGLAADRFGMTDRGYVRAGMAADLVLFDPATVADMATYAAPTTPARGIHGVWVNGVPVLEHGVPTGRRGGRLLERRTRSEERV